MDYQTAMTLIMKERREIDLLEGQIAMHKAKDAACADWGDVSSANTSRSKA